MAKQQWAEMAYMALRQGQSITVQPRGRSMTGLVSEGETVTLEPYGSRQPAAGDIVLARIQGRRYSHLVLHLVLTQEPGRYLIGNSQGRVDGWVTSEDIFGRLTEVAPGAEEIG